MKVLFLTPYPKGSAPSQRFRFEQYYDWLEAEGIAFETASFWDLIPSASLAEDAEVYIG